MAKTKITPKYNKVKFSLFEKDGQIMISLQMILSEIERSGVSREEVLEYYVAQDHRNIQAIINTLVETAKDFAFVNGNLESTYRKNDVFVIQDYEHIKYHPDLQKFVKKFHKRIEQAQKNGKIKNLHIAANRRKFLLVRNLVGVATIIGGITATGFSEYGQELIKSSGLFQNENLKDLDQKAEVSELNRKKEILVNEGFKQFKNMQAEIVANSLNVSLMPEISEAELSAIVEPIRNNQEDLEEPTTLALDDAYSSSNVKIDNGVEKIVAQNVITEEKINVLETIMPSSRQAMREVQKDIPIIMNETGTGINYIETYNLTPTEIDTIKATVQHESGFQDEREVYAVMSTVINRSKSGKWNGGKNPYQIVIAPGQFQSYYEDHYKKYLNGNYAEYTSQIVDAMLAGELEPFHEFERFASGESAQGTQFTKNGNFFR